jgi:hypothetical protein
MPLEHEPSTQVPTQISKEAWEAAMDIDTAVEGLLADYGITRKEGHTKVPTIIAKMVQLAINKSHEKRTAEEANTTNQSN